MTHKQFQSAIKKRPFTGIVIRTARGESYTVTHPEAIWLEPEGTTILFKDKEANIVIIDAALVSEVI